MALNIKDAETDRLARELAQATGESLTQAVRTAMEERLRRVRRSRTADDDARIARLHHYIERGRARKLLDTRSEDEILGYDEHGLPTS